ncbi:hypothetical protein ACJX0J_034470 [Zea mays]
MLTCTDFRKKKKTIPTTVPWLTSIIHEVNKYIDWDALPYLRIISQRHIEQSRCIVAEYNAVESRLLLLVPMFQSNLFLVTFILETILSQYMFSMFYTLLILFIYKLR